MNHSSPVTRPTGGAEERVSSHPTSADGAPTVGQSPRPILGTSHAQATGSASFWRLAVAVGIATGVLLTEVVGGILAGSLALLGDATHVGLDILALLVGLGAARLARRPPDSRHTYGFHRIETIGALVNSVLLLVAGAILFTEGIQRLAAPQDVDSSLMLLVAFGALVANGASAWLVVRGESRSLNTRAVLWHLAGDAAGSAAVLVAAGVIATTGWHVADPIATLIISCLLFYGGGRLLLQVVHVLAQGAPSDLPFDRVVASLGGVLGVTGVHDVHIWSIADDVTAVTAHLDLAPDADRVAAQAAATSQLAALGAQHIAVQVDPCDCGQGRVVYDARVHSDEAATGTR